MNTVNRLVKVRLLVVVALCFAAVMQATQSAEAIGNGSNMGLSVGLGVAVTVVNAASYDPLVAPGSIAALFGSGMTSEASQTATTLPLPTTLAGLTVKINGVAAPLFYASTTQINLQIPGSIAPGTANVEVFAVGGTTPVATGPVAIADSSPGVFSINASGRDQAAALNSDYSINAAFDQIPGSRPEVTGKYVTIFATGVGNTNPLVADGQAASSTPLAVATSTTAVTIGGVSAEVLFSGLAPGFVGLWQINAFLPGSLATNFATPLRVELRSRASTQTTLAVASQSEYGNAGGSVVSALTGAAIGGAALTLQPTSGTTVRSATTDAAGNFSVSVIAAGSYTVVTTASGFVTASQGASIVGAQTQTIPPIALTEPLAGGQYRVVVTWQTASPGLDLDAHLTGPSAGSSRFHVWWNGETDTLNATTARLDRDDLNGAGPETVTLSPQGTNNYRFSVHNYSDRDMPGSTRLFNSHPVARIYRGNQQIAVVSAPSGGGTLWKIFEVVGDQVTVINQLSDEYEPSNIKTSY